ncbi:UspA domain-containing protein [Caballeronia sordidicola]|uniref:UspA domain-containing protein n=1 Tax=Caballeronia sordidicola TaxID=196367 RepID=A0A158I6A2_CABSO|nr:universal stress protein [Caballeronia sordidicola]SAL52086.1 UspA domain-containing protein [Caballeronia sordidicola]
MYKHILVPIDGSETSARALDAALLLARENHAELKPVYVIDVPPTLYADPASDPSHARDVFVREGARVIAEAVARMQGESVQGSPQVLEVDPVGDDITQQISRAAKAFNADLVVMGTHGRRGWRRLVLGSVAERFLRMSSCPVLLVPSHAGEQKAPHILSAPDIAGAWL